MNSREKILNMESVAAEWMVPKDTFYSVLDRIPKGLTICGISPSNNGGVCIATYNAVTKTSYYYPLY